MNKLIVNTLELLEVSVNLMKLVSFIVLVGTAGALENDFIDMKTFIIRTVICFLVMFFA